jgi:hypothetical protein
MRRCIITTYVLVIYTIKGLKDLAASFEEKANDTITSAKRNYFTLGNVVTMRSLWDSAMVRTQIYLTKKEKTGLKSMSLAQGRKQSDIIRNAIDDILARQVTANRSDILRSVAGIWTSREDIPDIRRLRTGWRRRSMR